ncbi:hypothetical protein D9758_015396 [Tetrapyrgos nigripes]|uniref:Uncharacterized protein n=1 Tax=Tetrapyrgos nigripes TaxID=182062 RepID=A0A8H5CJK7_9AGAR|nr:hypothetical protein D9758_015396 [Tetrapyrgos nigripes]
MSLQRVDINSPYDMGRVTYQDLYSGQLFTHGHGCALLDPEPHVIGTQSRPELREAYEAGIRIGDVGLIGKSGDFKSIFNIFKPGQDPLNAIFGVPPGFRALPFHENHVSSRDLYYPSNTWVCSKKARSTVLDADGGAVSTLFGPGLGIQFQFSQSQGAALFLPAGARRIDYTAPSTLQAYIEKNAVSWYQFVNDLDLGAYNGSLYLVTGYDRTSCYQNLAFSGSSFQSSLSFKFSSALLPTGNVGVSLCHSSLPSDQRWSGSSGPEHTLNNLSPFIRGFKVMIRPSLIPSLKLLVSVSDLATSETLSRRRQGLPSLPPDEFAAPSRDLEFALATTPSVARDSDLSSYLWSFESDSETESDTPILQTYHPSEVVNAYILDKCSEALVAVTHDNEWSAVLEETDDLFPDKTTLIDRMLRKYPTKFQQDAPMEGISNSTAAELPRHVDGPSDTADEMMMMKLSRGHSQPASDDEDELVQSKRRKLNVLLIDVTPSRAIGIHEQSGSDDYRHLLDMSKSMSSKGSGTSKTKENGPSKVKLSSTKGKGAVKGSSIRAKSGCYTCRIRRKCLGFDTKRPNCLREDNQVSVIREKIKNFLASQGMIKGHSSADPSRVQEEQATILADDAHSDETLSASVQPRGGILILDEEADYTVETESYASAGATTSGAYASSSSMKPVIQKEEQYPWLEV